MGFNYDNSKKYYNVILDMNYQKDLKHNSEYEKFYFKYANNNESIIRGCSLNLIKNNHRLY